MPGEPATVAPGGAGPATPVSEAPPAGRRGLVIAWMPVSQRSETIAKRLGYGIELLGRAGFRRPITAILAYPLLAARTAWLLLRRRPTAVIVIAPPVVAPLVVMPLARLIGARVAIDIHSGAMLDRRWRWSVGILAWLARSGVAVVTLPSLARRLAARRVPTVVLPDPIPDLQHGPVPDAMPDGGPGAAPAPVPVPDDPRPLVVAICGWGDDEPIEALVQAGAGRPWVLAVTGRPRRHVDVPDPVQMTGFLAGSAFVDVVARAAAVVVLTTRDDTLLSGAWEALALERPLVLSGTAALRETFGDGPAYVEPDAESIAAGIEQILADPGAEARTAALARRFRAANDATLRELEARWLSPRGASTPDR